MGSRKRDRLKQRHAAGKPLRLAIVTYPASGSDGVSLARDVELVKASALYADEIELVSIGAVGIAGLAQVAHTDQGLTDLFTSLDDDTVNALSKQGEMPSGWRDVVALLSRPGAALPPEVAALARDWQAMTDQARGDLAVTVEKMLIDSGAGELLPAFDTGLVRLSASGFTNQDAGTDDVLANWLGLLRGLLTDTKTRLLLDDQVGGLVRSMIAAGDVDPHRLTMRHAGQAALGSGLVTRLPAFPAAPLDEILDLREDLGVPLRRYRAAVVRLSDRLQAAPFDKDLPDEIDDLWSTDIQPALDDIDDGLHQHSLVREIARSARQDVKALVGEGCAVYVGFAGLASVNDWISAGAGLAGAATAAAATGAHRAAEHQDASRRHDLFYLYEADRRLRA